MAQYETPRLASFSSPGTPSLRGDAPVETSQPTAAAVGTIELGTVAVHTSEEWILAGLIERFGADRSFVRDTTWTLILRPGTDGA